VACRGVFNIKSSANVYRSTIIPTNISSVTPLLMMSLKMKSTQTNHYNKALFLKSAATLSQLPADEGFEVAFAGRSNAGKSSAINFITNIKGLARTSKTPGRTQLINLFTLDTDRRLVDLPGYGYAKVSAAIQDRWQRTLVAYLRYRDCLRGIILIMDIRHPLMELDWNLIHWAAKRALPMHILLTKADKLSKSAAKQTLQVVEQELKAKHLHTITLQLFSSTEGIGIEDAHQQLDQWFEW
jgi:GTP-binding protein